MKSIGVTEIAKEIKGKGVWGEFQPKKRFPETTSHKIIVTNSNFR